MLSQGMHTQTWLANHYPNWASAQWISSASVATCATGAALGGGATAAARQAAPQPGGPAALRLHCEDPARPYPPIRARMGAMGGPRRRSQAQQALDREASSLSRRQGAEHQEGPES